MLFAWRFRLDPAQENNMNAPIPNPADKPKLTDVKTLRESARRHVEDGAVTEHYKGDREKVLQLLNEALATEIICVLRYRHDYFMARGLKAKAAAAEFLEHANQELGHADQIAERIVQLGGEPDLNPQTLTQRSHAEYRLGKSIEEMIRENLVAERIAIDSYREMAAYVGEDDPTTKNMLEEILAVEEEHADDLADLLDHNAGTKS
jgi:bacterioferritin